MRASGLPFDRIGILAGLQAGSDLAVTATDQLHEFLRRRHVAAKFAALLRHRTTKACGSFPLAPCLQGRIDPQFGAVTHRRIFNRRLAGFAGRGCTANIVVATTHDCHPLLRRGHNAQALRRGHNAQARARLHGIRVSRPDRSFGSSDQPVNEAVLIDRTGAKAVLISCLRCSAGSSEVNASRLNSLNFSRYCFVRQRRRNNSPAR
ncbi:hypothetical protein V1279_002662 [Bradyrhizobium sp. AZCC 1610]